MLIKQGTKADAPNPWWMTVKGYWLASVFFATLYPRMKLSGVSGRASWNLIKEISY